MSNKYLEKIAEMSNENKAVGQAFVESALASTPAHLAGAALGTLAARKFAHGKKYNLPFAGHVTSENIGQFAGTTALGGLADIVALKHSLKGKINNDKSNKPS